jgi:hypothetical protein
MLGLLTLQHAAVAAGEKSGPPPAVKKVLSLFGSGREEDKMVGYLSFLKVGPQLLKFIPGEPTGLLAGRVETRFWPVLS